MNQPQQRQFWPALLLVVMGLVLVLRGPNLWTRGLQTPADLSVMSHYLQSEQALAIVNPLALLVGVGEPSTIALAHSPGSMGQFLLAILGDECEAAEELLRTVPSLDRVPQRFMVGSCRQRVGQSGEALQDWQQAEGISLLFYEQGQVCAQRGQELCARAAFETAAATLSHADWKSIPFMLSYFDKPEDLSWLQTILLNLRQINELPPGLLAFAEGKVLAATGKPVEALPYFNEAIAAYPDKIDVYYAAGQTAERAGRVDEAISYWTQGVSVFPEYDGFYYFIGDAYRDEAKVDLAYEWYEKAGDSARSFQRRAEIRFNQQAYEESLALYLRSLELGPSAQSYYHAARSALALDDYEQARTLLMEAVVLAEGEISYHLELADVCEALVDNNCAIEQYDAILRIQPDHERALARRAALLNE